jgi:O-antigen biosynthesis protein
MDVSRADELIAHARLLSLSIAEEQRVLRESYAGYRTMDRSRFARLRTWWFTFLDVLGLGGERARFSAYAGRRQEKMTPLLLDDYRRAEATPYDRFMALNDPRPADIRLQRLVSEQLAYKPVFSVIMPAYETPRAYLIEAIESVIAQSYPHWELCIADDASPSSDVREIVSSYAAKDVRIKGVYRTVNGHISEASNSAIEIASGEYIGLLDHDDTLMPDALFENALALNLNPSIDMLYSDEDKIHPQGKRYEPFFKPDWSPEAFLSKMYTCHFGVYRRSIINDIGRFRSAYNGSQDYDLVLRFTERTDAIHHIPRILYNWRNHPASAAGSTGAKPYAYIAAQKALTEALARRGEPGRIEHVEGCPGLYIPRFDLRKPAKVSIVIPSRDRASDLDRALNAVFLRSSYTDFDIVVVDNGTREPDALDVLERWRKWDPDRFHVVREDVAFNFSYLINRGVAASDGTYLVLLNNDTEIITADWLEKMMEQAQRDAIGAVGCKLLFPDMTVQHAGIVLGMGGAAGHGHYRFTDTIHGYFGALLTVMNYSAVTAAAMMVRREAFDRVGGFDEELGIAYNDVDFCLKLRALGLRNVYLPNVRIMHYESQSRGSDLDKMRADRNLAEQEILLERWGVRDNPDPFFNVNLALTDPAYSIATSPIHRRVFRSSHLLDEFAAQQIAAALA